MSDKYLKFSVHVHTWVTHEADSDDEWDRDSTDGVVTVTKCHLARKDGYNHLGIEFDVDVGDTIWLVWAQYSTGDSFGCDGGQYELCSVHKSKHEADAEIERLGKLNDYSVPWSGYFECLDFIKAQEMVVES